MQIGSLNSKAPPLLSWFVICCCVVTVGLLYVMQKAVAATDNISANSGQATLQNYLGS